MIGIAVLLGLLLTPAHFLPAEDVVILHAYSRNLAQHGAITFYPGGPHAEGATDFGWMLLVAAAMRAGCAPVWFTAVVNAASLFALAWALLRLGGAVRSARDVLALCGAAGLLPQILAAASGFPVLPYALLLTLLCGAVLARKARAAVPLALLLCLFRPDGVLFAVPSLVWLVVRSRAKVQATGWVLAGFVVPGAAYFLWRMVYFHSLLPLPFLVKADTPRFAGVLVAHSLLQSGKYLLLLAAVAVSLAPLRRVGKGLLLCLGLLPTLFFWTMRLDQNVGDRFFFYLPLLVALLAASAWATLSPKRRAVVAAVTCGGYLLLLLGPFLREIRTFRFFQFNNAEAIAAGLGRMPHHGTLLTTEAGYMAYSSGWVTADAWGLNTPAFARHLIQPADVVALRPDLIVLHPPAAVGCRPQSNAGVGSPVRTWDNMTRNVLAGAQGMHVYRLWQISYGSEYYRKQHGWRFGEGDPECFLVRQTSPLHEAIETDLLRHFAVPKGPE